MKYAFHEIQNLRENSTECISGYTDKKNTMEQFEDCDLDTFPLQLTCHKNCGFE